MEIFWAFLVFIILVLFIGPLIGVIIIGCKVSALSKTVENLSKTVKFMQSNTTAPVKKAEDSSIKIPEPPVKQPVEKPITPVVPQTVPELNQVIESPKTPITPTQPEQPTKVQPKIQQARAKRDNYTYIPSSENTIQLPAKDENSKNKYIPSQIGAKFAKTFDNSNLEGALKRADRAEQKALQTLAGNFGNM